jgi:hypothetical protein
MIESVYITFVVIATIVFGLGLNNMLYKKDGTALFFFFVAFALCTWLSVSSFNITQNFDIVTNSTLIGNETIFSNQVLTKSNYDVGSAYFFGAFAALCIMFAIGDLFLNWRKGGM